MSLPKRVWLVIILLLLAVVSLWLIFLKKELAVEKKQNTSLADIFKLPNDSSKQDLALANQRLEAKWSKLEQLIKAQQLNSVSSTNLNQSSSLNFNSSSSTKTSTLK